MKNYFNFLSRSIVLSAKNFHLFVGVYLLLGLLEFGLEYSVVNLVGELAVLLSVATGILYFVVSAMSFLFVTKIAFKLLEDKQANIADAWSYTKKNVMDSIKTLLYWFWFLFKKGGWIYLCLAAYFFIPQLQSIPYLELVIGMATIFFSIVLFVYFIRTSFVFMVFVDQKKKFNAAIEESVKIVSGRSWRVFAYFFGLSLFGGLLSVLLTLAFGLSPSEMQGDWNYYLSNVVILLILGPITSLYQVLIYKHFKA